MNLILAVFWLAVGLVILYLQAFGLDQVGLYVPVGGGAKISTAWFAFLLVLYNLGRWWFRRSYAAESRMERDLAARRRRRGGDAEERAVNPDPNFDFSDKPAASGENGPPA